MSSNYDLETRVRNLEKAIYPLIKSMDDIISQLVQSDNRLEDMKNLVKDSLEYQYELKTLLEDS